MEDEKTLENYPTLKSGSIIKMVVSLPNGRYIDPSLPRSDENCIISLENFEDNGIIVLEMPCKHPISPDALMEYVWAEVSTNKKYEVKCPLCTAEWPLDVIKRYSGACDLELHQLEKGLSENFCTQSKDIKTCLNCQSHCMRQDPSNNSVCCLMCTKKQGSSYYFCWLCQQKWKNSFTSNHCGNDDCDAPMLALLQSCKKVKVTFIDIEVYELRACPNCGTLIEHGGECKHMHCKQCGTDFCFVCLRMKSQGSWQCGSYNTECALAPIQEAIPRRSS